MTAPFLDRRDAGRRLGMRLAYLRGASPVVVAVLRGGVPVAAEVAKALDAPLDVLVVRKLGVPYQPELAMGAVGECGVRVVNAGPTKRIHPFFALLINIRKNDLFHDDWTTHFSPVYSVFDHWWTSPDGRCGPAILEKRSARGTSSGATAVLRSSTTARSSS